MRFRILRKILHQDNIFGIFPQYLNLKFPAISLDWIKFWPKLLCKISNTDTIFCAFPAVLSNLLFFCYTLRQKCFFEDLTIWTIYTSQISIHNIIPYCFSKNLMLAPWFQLIFRNQKKMFFNNKCQANIFTLLHIY